MKLFSYQIWLCPPARQIQSYPVVRWDLADLLIPNWLAINRSARSEQLGPCEFIYSQHVPSSWADSELPETNKSERSRDILSLGRLFELRGAQLQPPAPRGWCCGQVRLPLRFSVQGPRNPKSQNKSGTLGSGSPKPYTPDPPKPFTPNHSPLIPSPKP